MRHARQRTVGVIRILRALGPLPHRRRKLPRQQHPDAVARDYWQALMRYVSVYQDAFGAERSEIVRLLVAQRTQRGKLDTVFEDEAKRLVDRAEERARDAARAIDLHSTAERYGQRAERFQREQLDRQLRAGLGVPLDAIERPTLDRMPGFIADNVELIKTVPDRYFERIRKDVQDAFESDMHPSTLAEILEERDGMAESDAMRIARDQIGKLAAQVNEDRQEALGVTGYIWRTAEDERVREEHAERDGDHFDWDDPPEDGHPGEAVMCRCYAEPDLEPILESLDS